MSVMSERLGRWRAEGDTSALRIDPGLLSAPGAQERLVRCVLRQRGRTVPGVAPVLDLVSRPEANGASVWLIVSGPVEPVLDPMRTTRPAATRALGAAARALAALHAAGLAHGALSAECVVTGTEPRLIEAGVRAALEGSAPEPAQDVAAWSDLCDATARAFAARDAAAAAALSRAAAVARTGGLLAAAGVLDSATDVAPDTAPDPLRTIIGVPNVPVPPPPPVVDAGRTLLPQRQPNTAPPHAVAEAPHEAVATPTAGATMLGRRRPVQAAIATGATADTPPGALARFGPGVSAPAGAAVAWRGGAVAPPRRKRRRLLSLLGTLLFVAAVVLAWLWWRGRLSDLKVDAVTVHTVAVAHCNTTVDVVGELSTNGRVGVVRYHWLRNDGTDSGELQEQVKPGQRTVAVHLRWSFRGRGNFDATATLEVTSPGLASGSGTFRYRCP
jgi:hypothetical protein